MKNLMMLIIGLCLAFQGLAKEQNYMRSDSQLITTEFSVSPDSLLPPKTLTHTGNLEKRSKNSVKLTTGYTNGYTNGFAIENPVNKMGYGLNLSYRRDLSRLISVGLSSGHWKGIDVANLDLENRGSEAIKYLHVDLYLYLLHSYKHRLLIKVGGGLTSTKRHLGVSSAVQSTNTVERKIQYSEVNSFGLLVGGAYEYQLSEKWMVGASFNLLEHNNGGWLAGLSVGYSF